jgi:D-apionolactonase
LGGGRRDDRDLNEIRMPQAISSNLLLHGSDEPLQQLRSLRAGPLSAELDGIDLRYVRLGTVELVRRIYVAVRDRNWNTIPGSASDVQVEAGERSFAVRFNVRHTSADTDFSWAGSIAGTPEGRITFAMDGRAERELLYNRIGFCVLHPWRETAGRPFHAITPDGTVDGELPRLVGPQRFENGVYVPLFPSCSVLSIELAAGGSVVFEFDGDLFETEDQRNWTDASFKTYCTPLALGFPHSLRHGEPKRQVVSAFASGPVVSVDEPTEPQLDLDAPTGRVVPAVGLALAGPAPSDAELELLRLLGPAHLRCELHLSDPGWRDALTRASDAAQGLGAQLELAVFLTPERDLAPLRAALAGIDLARVLVVAERGQTTTPEETTPPELIRAARSALGLSRVPIAGGTDMYFCELNRTRPNVVDIDGVFWSLNAQVHAFDDVSLLETPEAQGEQVRTAASFAAGKRLFVGPVTLKRRYNVNATVAEDPSLDQLPDSVDPRQASLIGAAWTLASAKHLSEAGADAITYFETTGWRGVIQGDHAPPMPDRFAARAGQAFPLFHVLADVSELRGLEVVSCAASGPLGLVGLAARHGDGATTLLAANLMPRTQTIALQGVGEGARIRRLNEETAEHAQFEPAAFRATTAADVAGRELRLGPYETVRIDTQRRGDGG